MRRFFGLALLLCAALAEPARAATPAEPPRILVMLRLAPEHMRPGSDYGGGYSDELARAARARLADRIARAHRLTVVDGWPMPIIGVDCVVMSIPDDRATDAVVAAVAADRRVEWTQPLNIYAAQAAERGDPMLSAQPAARAWRLTELHRIATGRRVSVAVIDSGIERAHPDLAGRVASNINFVTGSDVAGEEHGTSVAGVIAATANNGIGIAGIAPGARLLGLRACWQTRASTLCDSLSLAKALHHAILAKAQVINMSLGGPPDRLLARLLDVAVARGASVVAAIDPSRADGGFPAAHPGVIAVDSSAARRADVYRAPGRDILTTGTGGRWHLVDGSSYAAAHVSGLMALLRERRAGATALGAPPGEIDACATLARAAASDEPVCAPEAVAVVRR